MTHPHEEIIKRFYTAFQTGDFLTMQACYHEEARFNDPVFQNLNSKQVKAMWQMLIGSSTGIEIKLSNMRADQEKGSCRWDAYYTFSQTKRKVHNIIHAHFEFRDGKIVKHDDRFNLWRWSRMALGVKGLLLGWSPLVVNKIRETAQGRLQKFMQKRTL